MITDLTESDLEGAVGYTPQKEETIPEWHNPREEEPENDELHELRRRRLERFSSADSGSPETSQCSHQRQERDNLELD